MNSQTTAVTVGIDSLEARTMATWALEYHGAARQAAGVTVMMALACGIQLAKAGEIYGHGLFGKWQKKYLPMLSAQMVSRYCGLVEGLKAKHGEEWEKVSKLLDVAPSELEGDGAKKVVKRVEQLVTGKTVRELFDAYGTTEPRTPSDAEAQKLVAAAPENREDRQLYFAKAVFGGVLGGLERCEQFADVLDDETRKHAVEKLTALLTQLTGAKVLIQYPKGK